MSILLQHCRQRAEHLQPPLKAKQNKTKTSLKTVAFILGLTAVENVNRVCRITPQKTTTDTLHLLMNNLQSSCTSIKQMLFIFYWNHWCLKITIQLINRQWLYLRNNAPLWGKKMAAIHNQLLTPCSAWISAHKKSAPYLILIKW